jgi:tetratricopeptide (TPR) repeat protein
MRTSVTAKVLRMQLARVARDPRSPRLYLELASLYSQRGDYDLACAAWSKAIRLVNDRNPLLVACLHEYIAAIRRIQGRTRECRRQLSYAVRAWRQGRIDLSRSMGPIREAARVREARCLAELGRSSEARPLLRTIRRGPYRAVHAAEIDAICSTWFVSL